MRNVWIIMQREIRAYFSSMIAYGVTAFFLVTCGIFFYLTLLISANYRQPASLQPVFHNTVVTLLLIAPAITMRLISEERRSGSIELLMTSPVTETQVVLGKYLGSLVLYAAMLGLTLQYPIILSRLGVSDRGPMISGYLGMFLIGATLLAVGLVASVLTKNQILAAIGGFTATLILFIIGWASNMGSTSTLSEVLRYLSIQDHFEQFTKGLISSRDVIFFLSMIGFCLFLSVRSLTAVKSR